MLPDKFDARAAADDETDRSGPPARSVAGAAYVATGSIAGVAVGAPRTSTCPNTKNLSAKSPSSEARNVTAMTRHAPRGGSIASIAPPTSLAALSAMSCVVGTESSKLHPRPRPRADDDGSPRRNSMGVPGGDLGTARLSEIGLNRSSDGPPRTSTNLGAACSGAPGADVRSKCSGAPGRPSQTAIAARRSPAGHTHSGVVAPAVHAARRASGGESGSPMDRGATRTAAAGGRVSTAVLSAAAASLSTMDDDAVKAVEGPPFAGSGEEGSEDDLLGGVAAMLLPESERTSPPPTIPPPRPPPPYLEHEGKCRSL